MFEKYMTLIRSYIEYCILLWAQVLRYGNWNIILRLENLQTRVTKIIKTVKDYSYRERLEKLGLTSLQERRIRSDLIKTF